MLDKKTLDVIEAALVKRSLDLRVMLKEHENQNSLALHKVVHRGGYFTHGQLADMFGTAHHEISDIINELRLQKQGATEREAVTINRDMPEIRELVKERWPLAYDKIKDIQDISEFITTAFTMKKGRAHNPLVIKPHVFKD
jgi:hypothetical protein